MALVAYDYSSDSENERTNEEEETNNSKGTINGTHKDNVSSQRSIQSPQETDSHIQSMYIKNGLFSNLPGTKTLTPQFAEENDKLEDFIPTVKNLIKEKRKVQISIPSLREFDVSSNDQEPLRKRAKPSQKGSGLLGILPPVQSTPMSNISFVPNAVKNKAIPLKTTTSKGIMPHSVRKTIEAKRASTVRNKKGSDSETDDEDMPIPDTFDDQMWEKVCGRPKPPFVIEVDKTQNIEQEPFTIAPEPEKPYDGLDNETFKELVGKTKKPIGNIHVIDINEDEILSSKDTWMMKSLTDPEMAPKSQVDDPVDPTRKRKHHITYLAQQARANEQELKTAWATSRNNRMMSRSKYGF